MRKCGAFVFHNNFQIWSIQQTTNLKFPPWDVPAGNHDSCIHHLKLDICSDDYNNHVSLQEHLIEEISQFGYIKILTWFWGLGGNKTKEINYSSLNLDAISFVLFP